GPWPPPLFHTDVIAGDGRANQQGEASEGDQAEARATVGEKRQACRREARAMRVALIIAEGAGGKAQPILKVESPQQCTAAAQKQQQGQIGGALNEGVHCKGKGDSAADDQKT